MTYSPILNPHPVSGPLTDAQLRATAVPVSNASLPLPAGAATSAIQTDGTAKAIARGGAKGTTVAADITSVAIDANIQAIHTNVTNASLAVTGTFWQATQPVSIAAAVAVTDNAGSLTVDAPVGTPVFVRLSDGAAAIATLPVSLASLPTLAAGTNNIGDVDVLTLPALVAGAAVIGALVANQSVNNAQMAGTATATGSGVVGAGVQRVVLATDVALPAGTNLVGFAGDLDRRAYVIRNFIMDTPLATPSAEALISVVQWYNNAAVAATTTPAVVPAGKILAITAMRINTASLAAAGMIKVRLRANTGGLAAVTSPLVCALQCGSVAAVAALQSEQVVEFPKPFLFPAGTGIGITHQGYIGATATLQSFTTVDVWGYEYTA